MSERHFCSRASLEDEAVLPGTGVRGEVYVFLPVRKALWGEKEFNAGWASPEQLEAVKAARRRGVVVRLYNPPDEGAAGEVLACAGPDSDLSAARALLAAMPAAWSVEAQPGPLLAVCTHGTRDRCCAKWGFFVYREARTLHQAGLIPFRPIECSHLGGDRYAATGIFFPSGSMYAHLDRFDLQALAGTEAKGDFAIENYRGRVFENELVQVVRTGLRRDGHAVTAASRLEVIDPESAPGDVEAVVDGGRRLAVSFALVDVAFYGSCTALERDKVSKGRRLVYAGARPA